MDPIVCSGDQQDTNFNNGTCTSTIRAEVIKNAPQTVRHIANFITREEETRLLDMVYKAPKPKWETLKERRLQNWGGLVCPNGLVSDGNIPNWLQTIIDRVTQVENGFGSEHRPNHVLVNEYLPGQGIMCSSASLPDRYVGSVYLAPRSLVLISDYAYSNLLHSIGNRDTDIVTEKVFNRSDDLPIGFRIKRTTRVSLTIRNVPKVKKMNLFNLLKR